MRGEKIIGLYKLVKHECDDHLEYKWRQLRRNLIIQNKYGEVLTYE